MISFVPIIAGLASFRDWTTLLFYDVNLSDTLAGSAYIVSMQYLVLEAAALVTLAALAVCSLIVRKRIDRRLVLAVALVSAMSSLVLECDAHVVSLGTIATVCASAFVGAGLGFFLVLWGCALMQLDQRSIIFCVAAAMLIDRVIFLLGILLPWPILSLVNMALPLVTSMAWRLSRGREKAIVSADICDRAFIRRVPWAMMAILFVCQTTCSVFLGLVLTLISVADSGVVNIFMQVGSCLVVLLLILSVKNGQLLSFWTKFLLVAVLGIAGFLVFEQKHLILFVSIVDAAGYAFVTFYMLLFPLIAERRKLPGLFFVALANLVCYRVPEFIGVVIGDNIRSFFEIQSLPITTAALAIVFVLFGVLVFAVNNPAAFPHEFGGSSQKTLDPDTRLEELGRQYDLAEREVEIAALMIKGRSARFIAEDLHLSQSTVHTYQRRMYQKLRIHSKQELIDLVEE